MLQLLRWTALSNAGERNNNNNNIKILLVDDQPDILSTFKAILEQHGYYVKTFDDPAQALDHLRASSPAIQYDLVITDYRMPGGISGLDLAKSIRDHDMTIGKSRKTKILLVTAYENDISYLGLSKALQSGIIDEIIQKPVSNGDLISVIEKMFLHNNH
jgi:CheY-like chemotaxis protein